MPGRPRWSAAGHLELMDEFAAALGQAHPGRVGHFATLPLPDVEGALEEASYALDVLGADGLAAESNHHRIYRGAARFEEPWRALDERGAAVFVPPRGRATCSRLPGHLALAHHPQRPAAAGGRCADLRDAAAGHVAGRGVRKLTGFTSAPVDRTGPGDAFAEAAGAVCAQRYRGLLLPLDPSGPSGPSGPYGPVTGGDAGPGPCSADAARPRRGNPGR
ncbi:amidohydrolase family protein [Streptomyces sp. H27-H1]|uniref:amidohydrolase family protein n=1 Tax=Streptomyces sp. H27-H1 TaxID=2996461 RepID=UPI00226ED155|nr:amidohydrolase family protein [Streptomyces sp. H27-H1]MCY0928069.1 amidohydrolase family protein [Streptomyces sp. H27-H1]